MMRISCPLTLPLASNPPPLVVVVPHVLQYGLRSQTLTPVSDSYTVLHHLHHLLHTPGFVFVAFICFAVAYCMDFTRPNPNPSYYSLFRLISTVW